MTVEKKKRHIVEDTFIFLAILVLWPTILGWEGMALKGLQLITLVCLVIVLVRRIKRTKRSADSQGTANF